MDSFNNAVKGIMHVIKTERNMKIHMFSAAAVLVLSLFFKITRVEFILVCVSISLVILCELFNTAVEMLVDIIVDVYHPKAGIIKDVAAGAVLVSALLSLVVAYFVFFDKVSMEMETGLKRIKQSPMHITIIALVMTLLLVLAVKAFLGKGTPFHGGMPSGHSAVAFSITTAIYLWSGNINITILSMAITLLLLHSRLEAKIHTLWELFAGAVLGFLVTLALYKIFCG
jgi:diacylglycerol kinase (ATP)